MVGTWLLESSVRRFSDGTVEPLTGGEANGSLMYDPDGRMSAHIFRVGRKPFVSPNPQHATAEEVSQVYEHSVAYFGSYTVLSDSQVVHHVEGSLFPNLEETDLIRNYRIDGDRLLIATPEISIGDQSYVAELVWRKVD